MTHSCLFLGSDSLSSNILELSTPYSLFKYFFTEYIISNIVLQSLFSIQKDPSRPVLTNLRKLDNFFHFNDNTTMLPIEHSDHDRLHKVRPLLTELNKRFSSIPLERHLSIYEQLCSNKSRHFLKQYLPLKPHKWGYKFFVLCGVSGFAYKFEVYSGKENIVLPNEPDLGAAANIAVRLCRDIKRNQNYRVFFDNYYSTILLVSYLAQQGILSLGAIRRNRIVDCKLPTEKELKKEERGYCTEYIGVHEGVDKRATKEIRATRDKNK
ncbi:hypothetical protein NQ318_009326 [Aromia moschata]|uniref:PiggyBac transposable element-derived protein domain-containing protein n=1 Tax=Aromia moschata TaxID=1265417 RepID=A0AAV8X5Y9_9CUCU|nr:hypothetical protein NQ318_009326 [Aromia moschata]